MLVVDPSCVGHVVFFEGVAKPEDFISFNLGSHCRDSERTLSPRPSPGLSSARPTLLPRPLRPSRLLILLIASPSGEGDLRSGWVLEVRALCDNVGWVLAKVAAPGRRRWSQPPIHGVRALLGRPSLLSCSPPQHPVGLRRGWCVRANWVVDGTDSIVLLLLHHPRDRGEPAATSPVPGGKPDLHHVALLILSDPEAVPVELGILVNHVCRDVDVEDVVTELSTEDWTGFGVCVWLGNNEFILTSYVPTREGLARFLPQLWEAGESDLGFHERDETIMQLCHVGKIRLCPRQGEAVHAHVGIFPDVDVLNQ